MCVERDVIDALDVTDNPMDGFQRKEKKDLHLHSPRHFFLVGSRDFLNFEIFIERSSISKHDGSIIGDANL